MVSCRFSPPTDPTKQTQLPFSPWSAVPSKFWFSLFMATWCLDATVETKFGVLKSLKSTTLSICISCISHWFCWLQLFILTAVEECGDGRTKWGSFKPDAFGLVIIVPNADNHYHCITPTIKLDPKKDRSDPHSIQIPPAVCRISAKRQGSRDEGMKGWSLDAELFNSSSPWFTVIQQVAVVLFAEFKMFKFCRIS